MAPRTRVVCAKCGRLRLDQEATKDGWHVFSSACAYCRTCAATLRCSSCKKVDSAVNVVNNRMLCSACAYRGRGGHAAAQQRSRADQSVLVKIKFDKHEGSTWDQREEADVWDDWNEDDMWNDSYAMLEEDKFRKEPWKVEVDDVATESDDTLAPLPPARPRGHTRRRRAPVHRDTVSDGNAAHIVLLLDNSGSMRLVDVVATDRAARGVRSSMTARAAGSVNDVTTVARFDAASACAISFMEQHARLHAHDVFSVAIFNESVDVVCTARNAEGAQAALEGFWRRGARGTSYQAALGAASRLLDARPGMLGHVVLLSDGRPGDTKAALEFFQKTFFASPERRLRALHGIGFGTSVQNFTALQQLACLSGGSFVLSGCNTERLCDAFTAVSTTITTARSAKSSDSWVVLEQEQSQQQQVQQQEKQLNQGVQQRQQHQQRRLPRNVVFELPELQDFGKRGVLRFTAHCRSLAFDGDSFLATSWPVRHVARRTRPYMRGGMRLVYGFRDEGHGAGLMVAKCSRFLDASLNTVEAVESHVRSTAVARHFAEIFNTKLCNALASSSTPSKARRLAFEPCFVYETDGLATADTLQYFSAEKHLSGVFMKYNSNNGFVSEDALCGGLNGGALQHHDVVQSFTHFTFEASGRELLVADLQGVARDEEVLLTDPQVLTRIGAASGGLYGIGDIGAQGMRACLLAHRCGPTCRMLGLKPVNLSVLGALFEPSALSAANAIGEARPSARGICVASRSASTDTDWDRVVDTGVMHFALNDDSSMGSRQSSASSWSVAGTVTAPRRVDPRVVATPKSASTDGDWDHVAKTDAAEFALDSDRDVCSSQCSGTSWTHILES